MNTIAALLLVGLVAPSTAASNAQPPPEHNTCTAPIQANLLFGLSQYTDPLDLPVNKTESLAEAVCCDKRAEYNAEPRYLVLKDNTRFFASLNASGITTFYDSVCGLPVFQTPINRTFEDFKADTTEHGWPAFRAPEVIAENVHTDRETRQVRTACGTHLGTLEQDDRGDRWCMDLVCISGRPQ